MDSFLDIKSMNAEEKKKIVQEIKRRIEEKKKSGILTEKEVREIEEMKLRPLSDILDVQGVYESITFDE